jgi:hypothetical protein
MRARLLAMGLIPPPADDYRDILAMVIDEGAAAGPRAG